MGQNNQKKHVDEPYIEVITNHTELAESVEHGKVEKLEYEEIYRECSTFS